MPWHTISTKMGNSVGMYFSSGGSVVVAAFFLCLRGDRRGDAGDGWGSLMESFSGEAKCPIERLRERFVEDGPGGRGGSGLSR